MKYMEVPELAMLSRMLTHNSNECSVHTRLEAYSCKAITKDKRMHRHLEHNYHVEELATSGSPPHMHHEREQEVTAFGTMDNYSSRKTLYLLIGTLNHAFPDHDFSNLRPDNFSREASGAPVLNALSTTLLNQSPGTGAATARSYSAYPPTSSDFFPSSLPTSSSPPSHKSGLWSAPQIVSGTHPTLYKLLDEVIKLDECEVYTYTPDMSSDPHATDSDDDDADAWDSDETSSFESQDDGVFEMFDDDDELPVPTARPTSRSPQLDKTGSPPSRRSSKDEDVETSPESDSVSPTRSRPRSLFRKRNGGFLWSTHTFFHNRKQKRILYITTWSRKKSDQSLMTRSQDLEGFKAWDGAMGAGARAFGLKSRSWSVLTI